MLEIQIMPVGTQATRTEGLRLDIWGQRSTGGARLLSLWSWENQVSPETPLHSHPAPALDPTRCSPSLLEMLQTVWSFQLSHLS